MSKQNDNFNHRKTLDVNLEKKHTTDLGLKVPEDYFAKSKQSILAQTIAEEKKGKVINLSKIFYIWSTVAVVALLFTLAVFNPFEKSDAIVEGDILIASLIEEDSEADALLDAYVNDELLTEEVFLE
ncbi:conserved protein of unknown function [Tenacibaculum sp. 190524A02b]|uniref:hypothetical protein n=1 Tax=Tenacibaculum vairaonense TaxID=3137860 RepID=UPI0032B1EEE1